MIPENNPLIIDIGLHWVAVVVYVIATVANTYGLIFGKQRFEKAAYRLVLAGFIVHGIALVYRWVTSGHGPYIDKHEILSTHAWTTLTLFLISCRFFQRIKPISIIIFPAVFLMIAIGLFCDPAVKKLPPTLNSIWLVLHVTFYKISVGTLIIALAFSIFYILKSRKQGLWLAKLPEIQVMDLLAFRFAGFSFTFWAIAMLSGSIWAYESWGRFWGWDPVETWSLITWVLFGIYLHLRRFFGWQGEKAAYFYIFCFLVSMLALYATPIMDSSIHSEYFK